MSRLLLGHLRGLVPGRLRPAGPTLLLVLFCLLAGIPATIMLTPGQDVTAFGQQLTVGARPPQPTLRGPARLVQVGNTALDLYPLSVWGPLRPQLTMGPIARNADATAALDPQQGPQAGAAAAATITDGFVRWYAWAGLGLVVFTLAAAAAAVGLRSLLVVHRLAEENRPPPPDLLRRSMTATGRTTAVALAASVLAWAACGALAWRGTVDGLRDTTSLAQLVGAAHVTPPPVGPPVSGYAGAVIGDSRVSRLGGPAVAATGPDARPDDGPCRRSTDSLAAEMTEMLPVRVLNLACPDATVAAGLRGPQQVEGTTVPAQVSVLRQVRGLKFVVVAIGPNDVGWTDFLRYCYGAPNCSDAFTANEFGYRLNAFDRAYGDLLADLADLPGRPQVIVMTSYGAFSPDATCADTHVPGYPGLNAEKIALLDDRNEALNGVLASGAAKYRFAVARPALSLLCDPDPDGLGPDLQGMTDPFPFHPTGIGSLRMASSVARLVDPAALG